MSFTEVASTGKENEQFADGSQRDSREGKGRYDLLPVYAIKRVAVHFENGARKYDERNWEKGQNLCRMLDSAKRHIDEYLGGLRNEDHLAAAAWNILCAIDTERRIEVGMLDKKYNDLPVYPAEYMGAE